MSSKRGLFGELGSLPWMLAIVVILFIFGYFFVKANDDMTNESLVKDQKIDWEAGYLALATANAPVTDSSGKTSTLAEVLTLEPRDDHDEIPGDLLLRTTRSKLPDGVVKAAIISEDKHIICPDGVWDVASGGIGGNKLCDITKKHYSFTTLTEFAESLREEYSNEGSVGMVFLPSEPKSMIVVVVQR